jgi:CDP-glucose 4,6-dehydratase
MHAGRLFNDEYRDRTVLVTGHTGFKGSWLTLWLAELGARVVGYSLAPPTRPNHFELLQLDVTSITGDVRERGHLQEVVARYQPSVVFHLAAQPLVRRSFDDPVGTFTTNVLGTINVLEACRAVPGVAAVVVATSDKCYENQELDRGYRETDPLGGSDPYSCSKGCAELVTASYRRSFFSRIDGAAAPTTRVASVRAGNVIGGGDWAEDRLVPDIVRAQANGGAVVLRNPKSIRPWQHVLDPLAGYLLVAQRLLEGAPVDQAWNFGPADDGNVDVASVAQRFRRSWPGLSFRSITDPAAPQETRTLKLDCTKARTQLGWQPVWRWDEAVDQTAAWYVAFDQSKVITREQLNMFVSDARARGCSWTRP